MDLGISPLILNPLSSRFLICGLTVPPARAAWLGEELGRMWLGGEGFQKMSAGNNAIVDALACPGTGTLAVPARGKAVS